MRAIAICDAKNGKTDPDQLAARLDLLNSNPDLESRPSHEMSTVMKQFYELSNETEDSDDQFPANFHNRPDFESSGDDSEEESDEDSDEESEESGDACHDRSDRICLRTVIKTEKVRISIDPNVEF